MLFSRRRKYHHRCQEIIDDLHDCVANNRFINRNVCVQKYGKSDYNALLHELHLMNVKMDYTSMTPAMEWLYHSRHFKYKARGEKRENRLYMLTIAASVASILSAAAAWYLACKTEHHQGINNPAAYHGRCQPNDSLDGIFGVHSAESPCDEVKHLPGKSQYNKSRDYQADKKQKAE